MKTQTNTGYDLDLNETLDYLEIKSVHHEDKIIYYKNIKNVKTNLPDKLDELLIKKDNKIFSSKLFLVLFTLSIIILSYFMTQSTESKGRYTLFQDDYDKAVSGYSLGYEKKENHTETFRGIFGISGFIFLVLYFNNKKELKKVTQEVEDASLKLVDNHSYELSILTSTNSNPEIVTGSSDELISISKIIRTNLKLFLDRELKKQKELQKQKK